MLHIGREPSNPVSPALDDDALAVTMTSVEPVAPPRQPQRGIRVRQLPWVDRLTAAGVVALAVMAWGVGGAFTLGALADVFGISALRPVVPYDLATLLIWLIPLLVSAVEVRLWGGRSWRRWVWILIVALDAGSTYWGFVLWGEGRTLPLYTGLTLTGDALVVSAVLMAVLLTFGPEWVIRNAIKEVL